MVENLSKFLKTNNLDHKSCGFEQKVAQMHASRNQKANREAYVAASNKKLHQMHLGIKKQTEKRTISN